MLKGRIEGMKSKGIASIISIFLVIVIAGTSISCSLGKERAAVDMMKKLPWYTSFFNLYESTVIFNDKDFKDALGEEADLLLAEIEYLGLDISAVRSLAWTRHSKGTMIDLLEGDFNPSILKESLMKNRFDIETYEGDEIWRQRGEDAWLALFDEDTIVLGDETRVKDCLDVARGRMDSLYDNRDFRDIMERLPNGIIIRCFEYDGNDKETIRDEDLENLEVSGYSIFRKNESTVIFTEVLKFGDKNSAQAAIAKVKTNLEGKGYINVNVTQNAEFIKLTFEMDSRLLYLYMTELE
jgi:hypothetical protein